MEKFFESDKFLSIVKSKLARRFTLQVISFSLFVALIISVLAIYIDYRKELDKLNEEIASI